MAHRLDGRVAIVTGASRGLGQYCAMAYALEGARVAVVARSKTESNLHLPGNARVTAEMIRDYGGEAIPVICDVSDLSDVEAMAKAVFDHYGRIDVLMNNAGVVWDDPISTIPPRLFEQEIRVNLLGAFYCARAVLPFMRANHGGSMINVSGGGLDHRSHLGAIKHALEVISQGLADELRGEGIAVNCLRPAGWVDTPGTLVRAIDQRSLAPPQSYMEAAVLLALQTAGSYTGMVKTDAEVIRDLGDPKQLSRFMALNPQSWRESLR